MTKRPWLFLVFVMVLGSCGSGGSGEEGAAPTTTAKPATSSTSTSVISITGNTTAEPVLTAASVLAALKAAELPIDDSIEYTAETDKNEQLGRPGGYTSKVNFHDGRLEKSDDFDVNGGGSVEVFATAEDAKRRYDYIDGVSRSVPVFNEYHWLKGVTILRVSKSFTPDQASAYEKALNEL